MGSWCCRFAGTARTPCRRASRETSRRASPGCPVDPGAGSGASPASRAAPGASPAARRRLWRRTISSLRSRTTARRGRPGATTLESQRCRPCRSRVPAGARRTLVGARRTARPGAPRGTLGAAPDFVALLVSAGAEVNAEDHRGGRPLARMLWAFPAQSCHVKILEILLRAGATLDSVQRDESFDALLDSRDDPDNEHFVAMSDIVASVRKHGSWKAHCIAPHRMVLRLRSLVARGRAKPARTRHRTSGMPARSRQALDFLVRQGDNGIVWNILSYWRATK